MTIRILRKAGSLRTGIARDRGDIWHAVEGDKPYGDDTGPALCGTRPRLTWSSHEGDEVTCPRCLDRLGGVTD